MTKLRYEIIKLELAVMDENEILDQEQIDVLLNEIGLNIIDIY